MSHLNKLASLIREHSATMHAAGRIMISNQCMDLLTVISQQFKF